MQSAVQLSPSEIAALQAGTQRAWTKALALLTKAKKYIPQAYRACSAQQNPASFCHSSVSLTIDGPNRLGRDHPAVRVQRLPGGGGVVQRLDASTVRCAGQ